MLVRINHGVQGRCLRLRSLITICWAIGISKMLPATPSSGNRLSLFTGNSTGALTGINWVITREGEEHPSPLAVDFLGRAVSLVELSSTTSTTNPAGWSPRAHVGIASQAPPCPRLSGLNVIGLIAVSLDRTPCGLVSIAVRWCHPILRGSWSTITHVGELAKVEDLHKTPSHEKRKAPVPTWNFQSCSC